MPVNWRSVNQFIATSTVVAALGISASSAFADGGGDALPNFMMEWDASNDGLLPNFYNPLTYQHDGVEVLYQTWTLGGAANGIGGPAREVTGWRYQGGNQQFGSWTLSWDCVVNPDPFVDATINVTNDSNSTQTFWIYMPLGIAPPILGGSITNGSVSAVLVGNNLFEDATLSANGLNPVYQSYIDGNPFSSMWNSGYTLNAAAPFGNNSDNSSFSNVLGPDVTSQIGIRIRFDLSAGDSASITAIFGVEAIPAPSALAALAFAAVGGRRRRRN